MRACGAHSMVLPTLTSIIALGSAPRSFLGRPSSHWAHAPHH